MRRSAMGKIVIEIPESAFAYKMLVQLKTLERLVGNGLSTIMERSYINRLGIGHQTRFIWEQ